MACLIAALAVHVVIEFRRKRAKKRSLDTVELGNSPDDLSIFRCRMRSGHQGRNVRRLQKAGVRKPVHFLGRLDQPRFAYGTSTESERASKDAVILTKCLILACKRPSRLSELDFDHQGLV